VAGRDAGHAHRLNLTENNMKLEKPALVLAAAVALVTCLGGCAVTSVASATVSVAATAVGAVASVAGLAVDATVGTARLAGRTVAAVVPGGSD
jgi:hypothetical protein